MSFNRENAIWKTADRAGWRCGFYRAHVWGEDDEWDVNYDYDHFEWVSPLCGSQESARLSWDGANPGAWDIYDDPEHPEQARKFDAMADELTGGKR